MLQPNKFDTAEVVDRALAQRTDEPVPETPAPSSTVASRVHAALKPFAVGAPGVPVTPEPPTMWTLLAFARREFDPNTAHQSPTVDPLAGQVTDAMTTNAATLDQPTVTWPPAEFTGQPSPLSKTLSAAFRVLGEIGTALHVDLTIPVTRLLTSARPPRWTTLGLTVQRSEFDGMRVWTLQSADPSGKDVVGIHGGGVVQPLVFNWLDYAAIARDTGATVIVPLYPLVSRGGTAATVVPAMADLISAQIDQHGAGNVSVYGDSAGGEIALSAVQEIVRRGDPVPSHMVLISPPVDATFTNPAIPLTGDPVFTGPVLVHLNKISRQYAGGLDLTDPLVSPLYGSLAGLPPTTVYAGSNDITAPDLLRLRDKALATPGADFTFVLRKGEPHDWAIFTIFPETKAVLPDIYQQLGISPGASSASPIPQPVSGTN
ncbi:alpha/beta hydrolase fold domain-containing protein [Mycolicibacterium chubuense]|uniref:alpha/beta hydrolase fold domain-containing protein n=1 Tax=Mycolicibacterium chubuense TaxID=1800 RepID=UPI0002F970EC|nr:alpha/beta hydrolase [Mycolicibacterium chubuense]